MARRIYWTSLIYLLRKVCLYIVRYQATLLAFATDVGITNAAAKLAAVMAACEAITEEYDNPPNP